MADPRTNPPPTPVSRGGFPEAAREHGRWNYTWHTLEGGLYMGGAAFIAVDTVLPNLVHSFNGPEWLISATPLLTMAGVMGPQLIAAHWVERLSAVHRYTLVIGLLQRIPFLLGGLGLLVFGPSLPMLALVFAMAAPLLSGFFAGVSAPAWKELVSRTVSPERRASMHALRNTLAAGIGLVAGWTIHEVLKIYPGSSGYSILFFITFFMMMISWLGFRQLREIPQPGRRSDPNTTLLEKLMQLPELVRRDKRLLYMSISNASGPTIFIVVPFAAVHATQVTGLGDSFVGLLVIAKTVGLFLGNFLGGYFGDTRGGRLPLMIARALRILFCIAIPFAATREIFLVLFCLYGVSFTLNMIGNQVLSLEISPDGKRPTYLGIISAATFPSILMVPVVSWTIRQFSQEIWPLAVASIVGTSIGLVVITKIQEPRFADQPQFP